MHDDPRFNFELEAEVFEKSAKDGRDWRIAGIVSTDGVDRQGERLLQEGLDFQPFVKSGWFNDNHDSATGAAVGYPTMAELRTLPDGRQGWYVEGYLLKGYPRAEELWHLANALQKSDRKLGFSVEGQIIDRDPTDPSTVRKAIVREVAITRCPVNTETGLRVLAKSLSAGSAVALPTSQGAAPVAGDGGALRTEALEGGLVTPTGKKKKRTKKRLTKSEAIVLLRELNPALTESAAEMIVVAAMQGEHR